MLIRRVTVGCKRLTRIIQKITRTSKPTFACAQFLTGMTTSPCTKAGQLQIKNISCPRWLTNAVTRSNCNLWKSKKKQQQQQLSGRASNTGVILPNTTPKGDARTYFCWKGIGQCSVLSTQLAALMSKLCIVLLCRTWWVATQLCFLPLWWNLIAKWFPLPVALHWPSSLGDQINRRSWSEKGDVAIVFELLAEVVLLFIAL